ncbi:MAG: hypothetical protein IJC68_04480 [Firmicutes bacterium]|nr:hypothetical protein [Bacillota bacterium]
MMEYDKLYSSDTKGWKEFQLASGHSSTTVICFEEAKILAKVEAKGKAAFLNEAGQVLAEADVSAQTGGREVYETLRCCAEDGALQLQFPVVEWIDNYPHCDGEHDRWDSRVLGYHTVTLDLRTCAVTVLERA